MTRGSNTTCIGIRASFGLKMKLVCLQRAISATLWIIVFTKIRAQYSTDFLVWCCKSIQKTRLCLTITKESLSSVKDQ